MNDGYQPLALKHAHPPPDSSRAESNCLFRPPDAGLALAIHDLIADCPPLDANSLYCNLLQCTHFAGTSAVALLNERVVAFASGHIIPERTDHLFIWQIAVASETRGRGLAKRLIRSILERPACHSVRFVSATVTGGNASSRAMFASLARDLDATIEERKTFDRIEHFGGRHDSEFELDIGPF